MSDLAPTIHAAIERLEAIPRAARIYDCSAREARSVGLDRAVLDELTRRGWSIEQAGETRYAWSDLQFIGLRTGHDTPYMRMWRSMNTSVVALTEEEARVSVAYIGTPSPGVTTGRALTPEGNYEDVVLAPGQPAYRFTTSVGGRPPRPLPAALRGLCDEIVRFDLCELPIELQSDVEFMWATRLTDCVAASRMLVERATQLGFEARTAWGLFIGIPFSSPHAWAELLLDGVWHAYDPLLLSTLERFGGLDGEVWGPMQSLTGVVKRYEDDAYHFLLEGDPPTPIKAAFLTRRLSA